MPKITTTQLTKVVKLSKLRLTNDQKVQDKLLGDVTSILELADDLQTVDTGQIQPMDGWRTNHIDDLREDEPDKDQTSYQRIRQNIIKGFPESQNNLLVLAGIFENS
jgi:aspartyl/glutamyl-tRNA(Asn/Gln) amidotransferase C subunit